MTDKEAMKLALDALENHCGNYKLDDAGCDRYEKATTALKEALAQTEQEPVAHQKWCASLTQLLLSMPPQPAPCNCHPPQRTEQNFCSRCGKRTPDLTHIHTCTPPREGA